MQQFYLHEQTILYQATHRHPAPYVGGNNMSMNILLVLIGLLAVLAARLDRVNSRTLAGARRSLEQGYATLAKSDDLAQLADAAESLARLADDLAARARQCFELALP